ncbi:CLUMA_CG009239, isoform A [Clunio marinus]|uniref:CLUMA_CG009239, isoform A n=1 Tax=Clunio marinus TaxID=568069 RepID=A0A1J1I9Z0_9DIPT|nr:CLUMA_CG009239, isoform A [Clunio marinus]
MEENQCFICADDCTESHFYLVNLSTKKYKTNYTSLISDLINSEYELRVSNENKICECCSVLIEKFDELQHETKTVKSVLSRQIANTYKIETSEPMVFMDKSKIFIELPSKGNSETKYSCKLCPRFVTTCLDTVNTHILYHKISTEGIIQTQELLKEFNSSQKRNNPIGRELPKKEQIIKTSIQRHAGNIQKVKKEETETKTIQQQDTTISIDQEYDEETLDSLIDLDLLKDPLCDSNVKSQNCMIAGCTEKFNYINDYVRHLKLKHKSTLNHIFAVVRANIKRPKKMSRLMCPYCFTKISTNEALEFHVKQHEDASKVTLFTDRVNDFVSNIMSSSRCQICDCDILDPTVLDCNHEIVKNGMAPKIDCIYCTKFFYSGKLYNNHLALDHNSCFMCGSICDDKSVLADHIKSHLTHAEYPCSFCENIYQSKSDRLKHMKDQHVDNCCNYCDDWFLDVNELQNHLRYAHAGKRMEQTPTICDECGASFKNNELFLDHQNTHQKRKIFKCSSCSESFRFRYLLMDHISTVHNRTIVDNETNFYKCFICMLGFSSQHRKTFVQHLKDHKASATFCTDCNANLENTHNFEAHRERSHQDFSFLADKKQIGRINQSEKTKSGGGKNLQNNRKQKIGGNKKHLTKDVKKIDTSNVVDETTENLSLEQEDLSAHHQQQQIMVQTEDGSVLNMNNFILTENGELIIQNLEGLIPNGQENADESSSGQIQISNLEQFLMEQGLTTEISYIQPDEGQVIIQNDDGTVSQSSHGSLLQSYKEIFEHDENIPADLIVSGEDENAATQGMILNGDYMTISSIEQQTASNGQVEIQNPTQVDANQSTLDELGDILLEVAAAAEKEKKPKVTEQKMVRDSLWGRKRANEVANKNGPIKQRATKRRRESSPTSTEPPASNFSQAYEFFVRGFDAKKHKHL